MLQFYYLPGDAQALIMRRIRKKPDLRGKSRGGADSASSFANLLPEIAMSNAVGSSKSGSPRSAHNEEPESGPAAAASQSIEMHLQAAVDALGRQDFANAVNALNHAVVNAEGAQLAEAFALRGYAYLSAKNFQRAEKDCTSALRQGPPSSETLAWRAAARGHLNRWRASLDDLRDAKFLAGIDDEQYAELLATYRDEAARYFTDQVQQGHDSSKMGELFCQRGWVYLLCGQTDKARRDFGLAQKELSAGSEPAPQSSSLDEATCWSILGQAEVEVGAGDFSAAVGLLAKLQDPAVSDVAPTIHPALYRTRMRALAGQGDTHQAFETLALYRQKIGDGILEKLKCAELALEIGDTVSALDDLNELLGEHDGIQAALLMRARAYSAIHNYQIAEADLTTVLQQMGTARHPSVLTNRGTVRLQQGKLEAALRDFNSAEDTGTLTYHAFLGRSKVYAAQGENERALHEADRALRLDDSVAEIHAAQARLLVETGQQQVALEKWNLAIEQARDNLELANYFYRRAITNFDLHRLSVALEDLAQTLRLDPRHAGAYVWRAAILARNEDWSGAMAELQSAVEVRPSAMHQYQKLGKEAAQRAVKFYTSELAEQPHDESRRLQIFLARAKAYYFLSNFDSSLADLSEILTGTEHQEARILRGQVLASMGRHAAAVEEFDQVLADQPDNHAWLFNRALSYCALDQLSDAWADTERAVRLSPNDARYLTLQGDLLQQRGQLGEARVAYNKAVRLDPQDATVLRKRGVVVLAQKDFVKAVGDFTHSLELDPNQADVLALRGTAHFKHGRLRVAREDFEAALLRDVKLVKAYCGRAMVLVQEGELKQALIWLTKAFHRFDDPGSLAELLLTRGRIYYHMGRFQRSAVDFSYALELQRKMRPTQIAARYGRALALIQLGELKKAQQDLQSVLKLQPTHRGAQEASSWLESGQGPRPQVLQAPHKVIRPQRPGIQADGVTVAAQETSWETRVPFNEWIVRDSGEKRKEFGPVSKETLDQWVAEGRLTREMKLLRLDWTKWKRASYVFPELDPQAKPGPVQELPRFDEEASSITSFPEIDL